MTTIDYKNFINSKIIHHNDSIDNFTDGLNYMIKTKASIISYNTKKTLQLHNIDLLEVKNNEYERSPRTYTYKYSIEKQSDIIENIQFESLNKNIKLKYVIAGVEYDNMSVFINAVSVHHDLYLKFIFTEKPKVDDTICITYKNYLLNDVNRNILTTAYKIQTDTHTYANGMCVKLFHEIFE
jgi:hypothetical protein